MTENRERIGYIVQPLGRVGQMSRAFPSTNDLTWQGQRDSGSLMKSRGSRTLGVRGAGLDVSGDRFRLSNRNGGSHG
jgi:hypothetical protein